MGGSGAAQCRAHKKLLNATACDIACTSSALNVQYNLLILLQQNTFIAR